MKRWRLYDKFKKMLIIMLCCITLVFAMPVKSKAGIVDDFMELVLKVPDAIGYALNKFIAQGTSATYKDIDLKGLDKGDDNGSIYNFLITPYNIFTSNQERLGILDVNFFAETKNEDASSQILAPVIGSIYKSLRNLCLVLMMLVLLYIGIRIMLSSIASEQAKYKQLLVDWLVGFALLFIMHYIMAFLMNLNTLIIDMLQNDEGDTYYIGIMELGDKTEGRGEDSQWYDYWVLGIDDCGDSTVLLKKEHELIQRKTALAKGNGKGTEEDQTFGLPSGNELNISNSINAGEYAEKNITDQLIIEEDEISEYSNAEAWANGNSTVKLNAEIYSGDEPDSKRNKVVYKCNLMEYARTITTFGSAYVHVWNGKDFEQIGKDTSNILGNMTGIAYGIIYVVLLIESIMFLVIYIKRLLQLAFLTMIAPLIAFMYPIDKVGDGKAQAFNTWFKDYLFNILLQPLHLLLYTILINGAMGLVNKNPIYALAVYGYMIPAEKYFKKIFGFDKASTGGGPGLSGALGAGMAMDGLRKGLGLGPQGGKPPKGGGSGTETSSKRKIPKRQLGKNGSNGPSSSGNGNLTEPSSDGGRRTALSEARGRNTQNGNRGNAQNQQEPGANGKGNKKPHPYVKAAKRKISKAMTGGKFDTLKGHKGAATAYLGKKATRFVGRNLGRAAGLGLGASAGLVAGAATAMATGDLSKLGSGLALGVTGGIKQGRNIGDWASGKAVGAAESVGSFANEVKLAKAEEDDEYYKKMRGKEALEEFADQDLTDNQKKIINRYAGDVDFNGDLDKVKAFEAIEDSLGEDATEEEVKEVYGDMDLAGNPTTEKGENDLRRHLEREQLNHISVDETTQEFKDNVDKEAQRLKNEDLKKAYQARENARDKLDEATTTRQKQKAQKELDRVQEELDRAKKKDKSEFVDSARNNVHSRTKQDMVDYSKIDRQVKAAQEGYKKKH